MKLPKALLPPKAQTSHFRRWSVRLAPIANTLVEKGTYHAIHSQSILHGRHAIGHAWNSISLGAVLRAERTDNASHCQNHEAVACCKQRTIDDVFLASSLSESKEKGRTTSLAGACDGRSRSSRCTSRNRDAKAIDHESSQRKLGSGHKRMDSTLFISIVYTSSLCSSVLTGHTDGNSVFMLLLPLVFIWSRRPMRYGWPSKMVALSVFLFGLAIISFDALPRQFGTCALADDWSSEENEGSERVATERVQPRLREGAKFGSTVGTFVRAGRRWTFEFEVQGATTAPFTDTEATTTGSATAEPAPPKEPTRLRVLENLALQRVVESIKQDPKDVRWTVTGVITEFEGENWLLVSTILRAPSSNSLSSNP